MRRSQAEVSIEQGNTLLYYSVDNIVCIRSSEKYFGKSIMYFTLDAQKTNKIEWIHANLTDIMSIDGCKVCDIDTEHTLTMRNRIFIDHLDDLMVAFRIRAVDYSTDACVFVISDTISIEDIERDIYKRIYHLL